MQKILLVEDEKVINNMLRVILEKMDLEVEQVFSGNQAIDSLEIKQYHMIITDIMMKDGDGFDVINYIKSNQLKIPIVVISALEDDNTKLNAYENDVLDYITKPFNEKIVQKKISNILNIIYESEERIRLNSNNFQVFIEDEEIKFTAKEFEVFNLLYSFPGKKFTKYDLLNEVWYENMNMSEKIVEVTILNIRKKLGNNRELIKTYRNLGYSYEE